MRWFVDVSRIGEDAEAKRYCVEAKQWQAALQQARKLRGDSGPLSKFSIELMEEGYRAVDPAMRVRYLVAKAPNDSPLSGGNGGVRASVAQPAHAAPKTDKSGPPVSASHPPATSAASKPSAPSAASQRSAPEPTRRAPSTASPAPVVSGVSVKSAPSAPAAPLPAPTPAPPRGATLPSTRPTQPSMEARRPPDFQLVRKREEEPRPQAPITYREYAYAVKPGTEPHAAELLLWSRFNEITAAIKDRPPGKFVQLAVFDHLFEKKPSKPPLATLAWKDWRGDPVVQFPQGAPAPAAPQHSPPSSRGPASRPASASSAGAFPPVASAPAPAAPAPVASAPAPAAPAPVASAPAPAAPAAPVPASAPRPPLEIANLEDLEVADPPKHLEVDPPKHLEVVVPREHLEVVPEDLAAPEQAEMAAAPEVGRQRRAGEDLISDLFEVMHELHFMPDMISGAEFLLGVLDKTFPCAAVLVHVFDINTGHFVIVRAKAPGGDALLLHRTGDHDPLLASVMRRMRTLRVDDAHAEEGYADVRWQLAGVEVESALCGPVQQGGRYLGMIELANPAGGGPFFDTEANALDYICEQFAEFLANRPIVMDADVVLPKR